jgi:hypothetical protein
MKPVKNTFGSVAREYPLGCLINRKNGDVGRVLGYHGCPNTHKCRGCPTDYVCVDVELVKVNRPNTLMTPSWCSSLYDEEYLL